MTTFGFQLQCPWQFGPELLVSPQVLVLNVTHNAGFPQDCEDLTLPPIVYILQTQFFFFISFLFQIIN